MKTLRRIPYLRFFIGLILILLIGTIVDINKIIGILAGVQLGYIAIVLALVTVDRLMMGIKWQVLLRAKDVHIPLGDVVKTYYIGNFLGFFLPPTVGGDIARALHMKRYERDMPKIVSSIVIERMVGFLALAAFSLVAVFVAMFSTHMDLSNVVWLNVLIVVVGVAAMALSIYRPLHRRVYSILSNRFFFLKTNKLVAKLKQAYDAYQEYQGTRRSLALFIALTMLETAMPLFINYFVGKALGLDILFAYFVVIIPIVLFIQRIPLLPTMIGVREGLFVVLFGLANVTAAQAFTLSALGHFLILLAVTPGLFFYFLHPLKRDRKVVPDVTTETVNVRGSL